MNTLLSIIVGLVLFSLAVALAPLAAEHLQKNGLEMAFNVAEGTHEGGITGLAGEVIALDGLFLMEGDPGSFVICDASDEPLGACADQASAIGDRINLNLLGISKRTLLGRASGVIAAKVNVYTDDAGKVQAEPTEAGTYWLVGKSIGAAAADEDPFEFEPCRPMKVVVVVALQSTNGTAAGAADLDALKTEAEAIGDDVRALGAALASPALVKVLV